MIQIQIPAALVEGDAEYQQILFSLLFRGILPKSNDVDEDLSTIYVTHIYQRVLPKLIADEINITNVNCWIEIDKSLLDLQNPIDLEDDRILRDYVLSYREGESKALIYVSHTDYGTGNRSALTSNDEFYAFIAAFKENDDLLNVFTEMSVIKDKLAEYEITKLESP